jgi:hypothetical protein
VQIELFPATTGGTRMEVMLYTLTNGLVDPDGPIAVEPTVEARLPADDVGPIAIDMEMVRPNALASDTAMFPVPGRWEVTVTARFGDFDQQVFTALVDVR